MLSLCGCRLPRAVLGTRGSLGFVCLFVVNIWSLRYKTSPNRLSCVLFISTRKAFLECWLVRTALQLGHPIAWT